MKRDIPDHSPITAPPPPRKDGLPHRFLVDAHLGRREYDDWTAACTYAREYSDPSGPRMIMHITVGPVATLCSIWDNNDSIVFGSQPAALAFEGRLYIREGYNPDGTNTP